jgi:hypothetical protein
METFRITFRYSNADHSASVLRSAAGGRTDYKVYPDSPEIIQKFGNIIIIFKEDENFTVNTSIDKQYTDYVNAITNALRDHDKK